MITQKNKKILNKLFGDKNFYKLVFAVTIPIILQNLITNFVSLMDNIMVGKVGTEQMSGVSIANQLIFVFNLAVFGAVSGVGIFTSQYFGNKDYDKMKESTRFMIIFGAIIFAIGIFVLGVFDKQLISLFLHEGNFEGDIELTLLSAQSYLKIILVGFLPFTLSQIITAVMRSANRTFYPMLQSHKCNPCQKIAENPCKIRTFRTSAKRLKFAYLLSHNSNNTDFSLKFGLTY